MTYVLNPSHPVALKLLRADERRRALAALTVESFNAMNREYRAERRGSLYRVKLGNAVYGEAATMGEAAALALGTCKRFLVVPPMVAPRKQRVLRLRKAAPKEERVDYAAMGRDFMGDWLSDHKVEEAAARLGDGHLGCDDELTSAAMDIASGNAPSGRGEVAADDVYGGMLDVLKERGLRP